MISDCQFKKSSKELFKSCHIVGFGQTDVLGFVALPKLSTNHMVETEIEILPKVLTAFDIVFHL